MKSDSLLFWTKRSHQSSTQHDKCSVTERVCLFSTLYRIMPTLFELNSTASSCLYCHTLIKLSHPLAYSRGIFGDIFQWSAVSLMLKIESSGTRRSNNNKYQYHKKIKKGSQGFLNSCMACCSIDCNSFMWTNSQCRQYCGLMNIILLQQPRKGEASTKHKLTHCVLGIIDRIGKITIRRSLWANLPILDDVFRGDMGDNMGPKHSVQWAYTPKDRAKLSSWYYFHCIPLEKH